MASTYPTTLDALDTTWANTDLTANVHPQHHIDLADAVNKIEAELGTDPSGSWATVKARQDSRQTCRKTADQNISSTTAANITDMLLPINTTGIDYRATFEFWYVTGANGVIQIPSIVAPTVGGHFYTYFEATVAAAPATAGPDVAMTQVVTHASNICTMGAQAPASTAVPAAAAVVFIRATCVLSNPTTTGSLQLRSALETGTTASAFKRGSWGELVIT